MGPSVAPGFSIDRKGCDSARASVCYLPLQTDLVSEWLTEVSCNRDPAGSQSDLPQLPPKWPRAEVHHELCPIKLEFVFWQERKEVSCCSYVPAPSNQEVIYGRQTGLQRKTGILQAHSPNTVLLFYSGILMPHQRVYSKFWCFVQLGKSV